jgi:adenylate kinase
MKILIAGVHGVGKSTLCAAYVESRSDRWIYRSASELIRQELGQKNWSDDRKLIHSADINQRALLQGVLKLPLAHRHLMLDGHFVLREQSGKWAALPEEVFEKLDLSGVVLVEADPELIHSRLKRRDEGEIPIDEISSLQLAERVQAELVCSKLGLPFHKLRQPSLESFARDFDQFAGNGRQ